MRVGIWCLFWRNFSSVMWVVSDLFLRVTGETDNGTVLMYGNYIGGDISQTIKMKWHSIGLRNVKECETFHWVVPKLFNHCWAVLCIIENKTYASTALVWKLWWCKFLNQLPVRNLETHLGNMGHSKRNWKGLCLLVLMLSLFCFVV